jgi:hypothetical protein
LVAGSGVEPEIIAKIFKLNLRIFLVVLVIMKVGISYHGMIYEQGKRINWKDSVSAIRCILYYNLFD